MKYLKLFESFGDIDWLTFSQELASSVPDATDEYYGIPAGDFYTDYHTYHGEEWMEEQNIIIGGKTSFKAMSSDAKQLWLIKKVADKLGGSLKMCDMGCGVGLVVKYCNVMGIDSMGVEYQKDEYEEIHKKIGIKVKYGDFFKMDLSFLKEQDIIYLYQPVFFKKDSLELLEIIEKNTKDDVVIIWNGMWDIIYEELLESKTVKVYSISRNTSDSIMAIITKI